MRDATGAAAGPKERQARIGPGSVRLGGLGECLTVAKRYAEAEPLLTESYKIIDSLHVPKSPTLKEARGRLATLYAAWGKGK
jgi:hypothetical protein